MHQAVFLFGVLMMFYVYVHRRNDTGEIFYVGKGCGKRAWKKSTRSEWWKRIEAKHGRTVEIIYKGLTEDEAFRLERETIDRIGANNLCNLNSGGMGGVVPSEQTRKRMSAAQIGRYISPETKEKMRLASTGRKHSDETKEKLRSINVGKTGPRHTEESRKAISVANKGRVRTPEQRRKVSESKKGNRLGIPLSDDHKEKLRIAHTGRKHTEEAKLKMSIASTGIKHSQETIAKMTERNRVTNMAFRKPVQCSNGMLFSHAGAAVEWLKENGYPSASSGNISTCCSGRLKTAYGFTWKFAV
jgi:hypothetical protein